MSDLRIFKTTLTAEEVYYIYYYSGIGDGNQYNQPYTKGIKLVDSGDVGIGTLNPSSKLHVEGSIRNDTGVVSFTGAHDIERGNLKLYPEAAES